MPGPRFARNRPTGVSGPSGRSSSIRLSPTRSGCRLDALVLDALAVLEAGAEELLVDEQRRVEIGDRDPDVMNVLGAMT